MAQDEFPEVDLAALSDDELTEQMHNDLYDGMAAEIVEGTNILLGRGWTAEPRPRRRPRRRDEDRRASTSATGSCSCPRSCSPPTR